MVISTTSNPAPSITDKTEYMFFLGALMLMPLIPNFLPVLPTGSFSGLSSIKNVSGTT